MSCLLHDEILAQCCHKSAALSGSAVVFEAALKIRASSVPCANGQSRIYCFYRRNRVRDRLA
jgi:hypothetical protein